MSWNIVKLDNLTNLISSGSTPNGGSDNYLAEGPVMFIRSQNVHMNSLVLDDVAYISDEIHQKMKRTWVYPGDVLLNITGASIGRVSSFELENVVTNVNQHVCIIRPKSDLLFTRYLSYFLSTPQFQNHINEMQRGGTRQALTFTQIANFEIPLPPLAEQQRIAAILDQADALRTKRRAALAKLDTLLQATFLHMFGDPVTNPMGWKEGTVNDVVLFAKDGPHVSPKYSEEGVPFLSTRHIRPGKIFWEDLKFIPIEEAKLQWEKCKPEFGDILYTKGGTTGFAKAIDFRKEIAIWVHIALLKTNQEVVDTLWFESMLNTPYCYAQSQRFTRGIANRDLGLTRMINIKLYIPPIERQRKFADLVRKFQAQNQNCELHLQHLDNLFHALQQRAFKGEL